MESTIDFEVGEKVTYVPKYGKAEKGRVKSITDGRIFVVFRCANNWDNYQDYTGVQVLKRDLFNGWAKNAL